MEIKPTMDELREEWGFPSTTPEHKAEIIVAVQAMQAAIGYDQKCHFCGHIHVYLPADKAYGKGHTYSAAGLREIGITGFCEFCFDEITEYDDQNEDFEWWAD